MAETQNEQERHDEAFTIALAFVGVAASLPLLILVLFFVTDLNVMAGRLLGMNLPTNEQLTIYNAICDPTGNHPTVSLVYWSQDAAPLTVTYGDTESPIINVRAGVGTLDVSIRNQDACPTAIILTDKSRSRQAGLGVEVLADAE